MGKLSEATLRSDYNLFPLFMNAGRVQICPLPVVGGIADETALSPSGSQCLASQPIPPRHALLHVTALQSVHNYSSAHSWQEPRQTKGTFCHQMKLAKDKLQVKGVFSKIFHESYETS